MGLALNRLILEDPVAWKPGRSSGRTRLGDMLNYYYRRAA